MLQDYAKRTLKALSLCNNEKGIITDNVGPLKTPMGQIVSTDIDMANTLNTYVSSVLTHEQLNNIPIYVGNTLDTFNFRLEDVQEKLNHLNMYKSTGPDLLHPRVRRHALWTRQPHL